MEKTSWPQNHLGVVALLYAAYIVAGLAGEKLLKGYSHYILAKHIYVGALVGFVIGGLILEHLRRRALKAKELQK